MTNLFQDNGLWAVGNGGRHFNATVNWTGVHNQGIGFGKGEPLTCQAVVMVILVLAGKPASMHAFFLQTQHNDNVDIFEAFLQVVINLDTKAFNINRQECFGCNDANFASQ